MVGLVANRVEAPSAEIIKEQTKTSDNSLGIPMACEKLLDSTVVVVTASNTLLTAFSTIKVDNDAILAGTRMLSSVR